MKLRCEVQISDHEVCVKRPGKAAFTQVSVGRKPGHQGKDEPIYVMLCTAQNRNGTKYVIKKNLRQIFGKFVREGKATIRFKNPPHDLAFSKANPEHLTTFLRVVKLVAEGKDLSTDALSFLAPASAKHVERPVTALVITKPSEYPMTFPKTLTSLTISDCSLRRVSPHILTLVQLTSMDLNSNSLSKLPDQFSQLKNLNRLCLSHNQFVGFPPVLCQPPLNTSLVTLDLKHNQIQHLPACIKKCERLQTIILCSNEINSLPESLGHMKSLISVSASNNKLQYLPGSMLGKLWNLADFSNNPFNDSLLHSPQFYRFEVPSLAECAARGIIKHQVSYTTEDLDWYSIQYLETAHLCVCGSACFESRVSCTKKLPLRATSQYQGDIPLQLHFCSLSCLKLFTLKRCFRIVPAD